MDQQYWQDRPIVYPQHPPIPYNNDHRTILDLNSAPVTNIIVQQFDVCSHNRTDIPTYYTADSGSGCYNHCYQSSEFNQAVYNGPGEAQPHMAESYVPQNISLVNSESFTGIFKNNHDIGLIPIKQEPIEESLCHSQQISDSLFNANNPYDVKPVIQPITVTTNSAISYPHCDNPGPIENIWPRAELSGGHTNTMSKQESRDFLIEIDRKNCSSNDAQLPDFSSHRRRISPERMMPKFGKSHYGRSGSLDPSRKRLPFHRTSNHDRRKISRSPKPSNRSVSLKTNRGSISSRKRLRSPLPQRSKDLRRDSQSSKNAVKAGSKHENTERERLVEWRNKGLKTDPKEKVDFTAEIEKEKQVWTRSAPADLFYAPGPNFSSELKIIQGTQRLVTICNDFEETILKKAEIIRADLPKYEPLQRKKKISIKKHGDCHSSSSSSSSSESEGDEDCTKEELEHKKKHPLRLHQELWFNDPGEMNDGPLCRCSAKARRSGIRHNIYAGENHLPACDPNSNNADRLHHYRITISPATNFLVSTPTIIEHDNHEYIFEGFSMFSHKKLDELPLCKVIRFNIEYTIVYYEEAFPQNFTVRELNLFYTYLFREILELVDLDLRAAGDPEGCPQYHFMPRFVRDLPGNGKEILSMNEVLKYLLHCAKPLIPKEDLTNILTMSQYDWQRFTENIKGMIVTYPGKKPCSLRVDQLDRDQEQSSKRQFPEIVHFGIRPPQLSYAGNPEYQKAWREYVKFRHLLANMPKPSFDDKRKLEIKENKLQSMRTKSELKRNVTVTVSSESFHKTGIMCDVVQHGMLIPVLVSHLRFHRSLDVLEEKIQYKFSNRYLLQLALTHPSYRENFGTNPDHARNSLTNCGIRQPVYGDRKIHYQNTRKRGINTLINIMSRFGKKKETESQITHNERLEFLGDAVVEFVTSVHLFHIFSDLEEGGLATYRAAIVQNQHLAVLAKVLQNKAMATVGVLVATTILSANRLQEGAHLDDKYSVAVDKMAPTREEALLLEEFMLYAHGSDLCHDLELRHAMANCFEALMGALFLDGGIEVADKVFGQALFHDHNDLLDVWVNYPPHPLQEQEPLGDRKWVATFAWLQRLTKFEESIGVQFTHIRLLARAFTDRSMGYTNLTLGSNQRLEFLGDTVLQLIASEYLYKHFPEHHEGHLSLLRSSLVNNRTQAVVCNDLDMTKFAKYSNPKAELKTKDRADLLEAFLGALYVDQNLEFCQMFCNVCFFPRLQDFIMNQDWNDPKSKLQQCCLTLRTMEGGEPEIPVYKVIECMGPTNTRIYTVAVYFKNRRLAKASGHSIQQAEMNAAKKALKNSQGLFPQLDHQRRVISKSMNRQKRGGPQRRSSPPSKKGDLPNVKNNSKNNLKKEKRNSRSLSPAKSKTNPKTAGDVFSQKIRCRTPPLAYQSRNRSSSPELKSKKDKKCKEKGKKGKDEPESDALSDKEPLLKKPRCSRSSSKSSTKNSSQSPCQERESKCLPKGQGSRSRSRSVGKQSLSSGEKNSSSSCCNTRKSKDVKVSTSSTTSMSKLLKNKNLGSSASIEKELNPEEVAVVPSSSNVTNIKKEPSGVKTHLTDQVQKSESGSRIESMRSKNPEKGEKIADLPKVKRTRSRSRNRSLEMPGTGIENTRPTNHEREDKNADLSKIKSIRSRNRSSEIPGSRTENISSTNPERGDKNADLPQVKRTRSRSRNRSLEMPGTRIENTRPTNPEREDKNADLSKIKGTRLRNRSSEIPGSRIENISSTNPERGDKNADLPKVKRNRSRSRNRSLKMPGTRIENTSPTNPERREKNADLSKDKRARSRSRKRSPQMPCSRMENIRSANLERGSKIVESSKVESTRSRSRSRLFEMPGSRIENVRSTNPERGEKNVDLCKVKRTRSRSRNRSPEMSGSRIENIRSTNIERGSKILNSSKPESTRSRSRNRSLENQSQRNCLSQRDKNIREISKSSNSIPFQANKRGLNDLTERESTRTTSRNSRSVSRSRDQTALIRSNSHQTAKRRSRSISNDREFRTTIQTRSPRHFRNCQNFPAHSSGLLQSHIPNRPRRSRSQSNSRLTTLSRAKSPQKKARSPPIRAISPQIRVKLSRSPPIRARSPQKRARSPVKRSRSPPIRAKSPQKRARSPVKLSRSPPIQARTPQKRGRSPVKLSRSPPIRARTPQKIARSPVKRSRSPPIQAKNPQKRARSPVKLSRSPPIQARTPQKRGRSPVKLSRSPPIRARSPQKRARSPVKLSRSPPVRARSPVKRSRSPLIRAKSPPTRAFSPQSFKYRRTPSRSPQRGRSSPKEDIQKNMMDFMLGKRSSPGIEIKSKKGTSWLVDLMFDQSGSQTAKPVYSSGSDYSQTHHNPQPHNPQPHNPRLHNPQPYNPQPHNPQPSNQIDTNSTQLYNQNGYCTDWQNTQYLDHQVGSNTRSYSNNTGTSYPPPNYHY